MKIKKSILGVTAAFALATVTLASCGGSTTYKVEVDGSVASVQGLPEDVLKVSNTKKLIEKLTEVTPSKRGYTFAGWYADREMKTKLTEDIAIKTLKDAEGKITVYAGFTINSYKVTFDYGTGVAGDTAGQGTTEASVKFNGTVDELPVPSQPAKYQGTAAEYSFVGWYKDAARTEKFNKDEETIVDNTTVYAKWEIAEIATAADFLEYVSANSTKNAVLTDDITFAADQVISREKANLEAGASMNSAETDVTISLNHKFFGNGHTVTGATVKGDIKCVAIWSSVNGGIYDTVFKGSTVVCTQTGTANTGFLFGQVNGKDAVVEDVVIDGVEMTVGAAAQNVALLFAQVKNSCNIAINGLVIKDATITTASGKVAYAAGIAGLVDASAAGTLEITDLMINGFEVAGAQDSGERAALVFGQFKSGAALDTTIDGAVISGKTTGKASSVFGDNASTAQKIDIKNVVIASFNAESPSDTNLSLIMTLKANAAEYNVADTVLYREFGVKFSGVDSATKDPKEVDFAKNGGTKVSKNVNLPAAVGSMTYAYDETATTGTYTLNINGTDYVLNVAKDPTIVDLSAKSPAIATAEVSTVTDALKVNSKLSADDFDANTMFVVKTSTLSYYQAAIAGKAGYGFKVTITPNTDITDFDGIAYTTSDLSNVTINETTGVITGYVILDGMDGDVNEFDKLISADSITDYYTIIKKISVQWFNNAEEYATPVEYSFIFQQMSGLKKGTKVADGVLAAGNNTDNVGFTATVNGNKLSVTAGNIAYNEEKTGNYVYVTVTKPEGVTGQTTDESITLTGSSATLVSYQDDVATIAVKVASGDNKFTVKWNDTWDACEYIVNIGGTTTITPAVAGAVVAVTTDSSAVTPVAGANAETKVNDYIYLVNASNKDWATESNKKTLNGTEYTTRLKSGSADSTIKVDLTAVSGKVTIKLIGCSSSGDSPRAATVTNNATGTVVHEFELAGSIEEESMQLDGGAVYTIKCSGGGSNFYAFIVE